MEVISSYNLQKYDEILDEINREHERSVQLKNKVQQVEDSITFFKLSLSPCRKRISHMLVKVFGSKAEIENLYDCDKIHSCDKWKSKNFYLIEVFLTKSVLTKVTDVNWKLHISVQTESFSVNKVGSVNGRSSLLEVIPVDKTIFECRVTACLFYPLEGLWNIVDLHSVDIDASYHFKFEDKTINLSVADHLLNITKLYNKSLSCLKKPIELQTQFKCNLEMDKLVAVLLKHSYHRLYLESYLEFNNNSKTVVSLEIYINNEKIVLLYNKDNNTLKIRATPDTSLLLKTFFIQLFEDQYVRFKDKMKKIKFNEVDEMDLQELLSLHQKLKNLWL